MLMLMDDHLSGLMSKIETVKQLKMLLDED